AFRGFRNPQTATAAETFREQPRKDFGHVLHDENGKRKAGGQLREEHVERRWAAGGDTDSEHQRLDRRLRCGWRIRAPPGRWAWQRNRWPRWPALQWSLWRRAGSASCT